MSANVYTLYTITGSRQVRRLAGQGRKPSGLAKPELVRLYAGDAEKLNQLASRMGYYWNRNDFIREAVRAQLSNSVYTELLNS